MYASVVQFNVDFRGDDLDNVQAAFERGVLPEIRKQPGYEGCYFLRTARGDGLLMLLWEDEAAAQSSSREGPLAAQLAHLRPLLRKPTEQYYEVGFADHPLEED